MAEDLFEEENENKKEKKSSEEEIDIFADDEAEDSPEDGKKSGPQDDDEAWIPLDDEELEITPADEDIDASSEDSGDEEILTEDIAEAFAEEEEEEADIDLSAEMEEISEDKEKEVSDDEAWIPLDDETLEDEEIFEEDISEIHLTEEEEFESDGDDEMEKSLGDEKTGTYYGDNHEAEAPPWDEGVEIPIHGVTGAPKKTRTFVIGGILFFVALIILGVYAFLRFNRMPATQKTGPENEKPSFVIKKMKKMPIEESEPKKGPEKKPAPEPKAIKVNNAPVISGKPMAAVNEGATYRFIPKAEDMDPGDKLTFFIANQPPWTTFDITTGALTGMPGRDNEGIYENIVILVSDGKATASLPAFSITVKGISPAIDKKRQEPQPKVIAAAKPDKGKGIEQQPEVKKEIEKVKEDGQIMLPDLSDLVRQSKFEDAALEYHEEVKQFPDAFTLKLEVDCILKSVELAFQQGNFDRRMFILPMEIKGKDCFVIFWGIYASKNEAIKALPSIPAFFTKQETKPKLVLIKQYL